MLMCVGTFSAIGQSQAGAFVSATIVSPVGADLLSNMSNGYSALDANNGIVKAASNQPGNCNKPSNIEHTITSAASIKIIGSVNVYDVSVQNDPILLRNACNDTMEASVSSKRLYSTQRFETSDATITIEAKITSNTAQANGLYKSAAPYTVTINYN